MERLAEACKDAKLKVKLLREEDLLLPFSMLRSEGLVGLIQVRSVSAAESVVSDAAPSFAIVSNKALNTLEHFSSNLICRFPIYFQPEGAVINAKRTQEALTALALRRGALVKDGLVLRGESASCSFQL